MTIKQMIQENNRLRERMTPANRDYVEDVIIAVRSTRADRQQAEKKLLEVASDVLKAQEAGRTASQLYGEDPAACARSIADALPKRKAIEGAAYYIMIPWAAFTFLFLVEAVFGLVAEWSGYAGEPINRISLLALIVLAAGSILLTELVTKTLNKPGSDEGSGKPKIDLKAIGVYLIILIIVMIIGFSMRTMLPVFTVHPWVSLVIGLVGLAGLRFIFLRRG
ncbi:putative membrane-anchored protein [Paenibacillus favisporus]|uniref:Membrane-anchored protein n=1 Tax=Paenibacillus favisporus TaxID=221028 RepID=A0ABV2F8Y8_9BACL